MRSLSLLFSLSICSMTVLPGMVSAQQTAPIYLTFSVPYKLTNLHPEITSLIAVCEVDGGSDGSAESMSGGGMNRIPYAQGVSVREFITQLKRAVDGSYSGQAVVNVTANFFRMPSSSSYRCRMLGCVADGKLLQGGNVGLRSQCAPFYHTYIEPTSLFSNPKTGEVAGASPDVRLKVSAPPPSYAGSITW